MPPRCRSRLGAARDPGRPRPGAHRATREGEPNSEHGAARPGRPKVLNMQLSTRRLSDSRHGAATHRRDLSKARPRPDGFSLIELLIVVAIIGIIAAIAIPNLLASRRAANEAAAVSAVRSITSAEEAYRATYGSGSNFADFTGLLNYELIDTALGSATTVA